MSRPTVTTKKTGFRLDQLVRDVRRFQNRSMVAAGYSEYGKAKGQSEKHIRDLVSNIEATREPLDPLIVWQDPHNEQWYVVDGFHRYDAYRRAMKEKRGWRKNRKVPCRIAQGSEDDVICAVYQENRKGKLGFDQKQRLQFVWEELWRGRLEGLPLRSAAERYKVGKGSISNMRRVASERYPHHEGPEPPCLWEEAKRHEEEDQEDHRDQSPEEEAEGVANTLAQAFDQCGWRVDILRLALDKATEGHPTLRVDVTDAQEEAEEPDF